MYRKNIRRYSTLDVKERTALRDLDEDIAGFSASAQQRRKTMYTGQERERAQPSRSSSSPTSKQVRGSRGALTLENLNESDEDDYSEDSDNEKYYFRESKGETRTHTQARQPLDKNRKADIHQNRSKRRSPVDRRRHHSQRREHDDFVSDSSSDTSHEETNRHRRQWQSQSRGKYEVSCGEETNEGSLPGKNRPQSSCGAWSRDAHRSSSSKRDRAHEENTNRQKRTSIPTRPSAHSANETLPVKAVQSSISGSKIADSKESSMVESNIPVTMQAQGNKEELSPSDREEVPSAHDSDKSNAKEGTVVVPEGHSDPISAPQPNGTIKSHPLEGERVFAGDSLTKEQSTLKLLLESLEEQSRLRNLLEVKGVMGMDMMDQEEAKETKLRLDNTLQELERVVQQVSYSIHIPEIYSLGNVN